MSFTDDDIDAMLYAMEYFSTIPVPEGLSYDDIRDMMRTRSPTGVSLFETTKFYLQCLGVTYVVTDSAVHFTINLNSDPPLELACVTWSALEDRTPLEDEQECVACMNNAARVLPNCGHKVLCRGCFEKNLETTMKLSCTICRGHMGQVKDAFL